MEWKDWQKKIIDYVVEHSGALIGAIVVMVAACFAARWLGAMLMRWLEKKHLEPPVRMLVVRITRILVIAFALVIALGTLGFNVMALVAGLGVAGVGVGLAMQGVLCNLVAGLTIIFTKPFRVGEYIELLSVHRQVDTIEMFSTTLLHPDRSHVVIPNRKIVGDILHNYGTIRQLDLSVGVAYNTNITQVLDIVRDVLAKNSRVLKEFAPGVGIAMLADSSIQIAVKPWVKVPDYGPAGDEIYRSIVERFRAAKVEIPFPQREVRLLNSAA